MADINKKYDAVIIGGGASGLMCAISALQNSENKRIAIIEKNERVGKKLLSTGNGRCNLTNINISSNKYYGSFKSKANTIFDRIDTNYILRIFKDLGLLTFADGEGRIYPISKQSSSVLDVLRFACERLGADIYCSQNIKSVKKSNSGFTVVTNNYEFICKKLVIACGSKAAPKLGGTSSGIDYMKNFGIKVKAFSPALCPVLVKSDILKSLKGLRVVGKADLYNNDGRHIKTEAGEIQFTEKALSGICIFNLSVYAKRDFIISLDLLPDYTSDDLYILLKRQKELFKNQTIDCILTGIFQKRVTQAILKLSNAGTMSMLCKDVSERDLKGICKTIKNIKFSVLGNEDFTSAQCTNGGADESEINELTMECKSVKNLYICGEAIDICGECGGYNLHFAFATGYIAGENL